MSWSSRDRLVRLDEHQVVRVLVLAEVPGGFPLGVQSVRGDQHVGQVQALDARGQFGDLVRLRAHFPLGHRAALGRHGRPTAGAPGCRRARTAPRTVLPSAAACCSRPGHGGLPGCAAARRCSRSCRGDLRQRIRGGWLHGRQVAVHRAGSARPRRSWRRPGGKSASHGGRTLPVHGSGRPPSTAASPGSSLLPTPRSPRVSHARPR